MIMSSYERKIWERLRREGYTKSEADEEIYDMREEENGDPYIQIRDLSR